MRFLANQAAACAVDTAAHARCDDVVTKTPPEPPSLSIHAVLCVERDALDRFGAVLRYLSVGFIDQAIHPRLVSPDPRIESLTLGPIQTVVHQPIGWLRPSRRLAQVVDVLSHQPPTLVHAFSEESYRTAGALAEAFDADLVLHVASLEDCNELATFPPTRVARYIAASQPLVDLLETELAVPSEAITLVRPGILAQKDVTCFWQGDKLATVLANSDFERERGVDRLIAAVKLLRGRGREILLFLLGEGRYEPFLRRQVREEGLSDCVTFAHPLGDVGPALRSADIFVRPSLDAAFSIGTLQAMGAGMAVVSGVNTVCDHLVDGQTAIVCPDPTPEALADALERLLADRDYARELAGGGLAYVREKHTTSNMASGIAGVYRKLALARATFPISE
jgi:glycosyltransferase involved in cell wall biosynthesis